LEHVNDRSDAAWAAARFALVARTLGRFNGAYLAGRPVPPDSWLHHNGTLVSAPGVLEHMVRLDLIADVALWSQPLLRAAFPEPVDPRLLRLWAARERVRAAISGLPPTLSHLDAWRDNLIVAAAPDDSERLVAIDWAGVGLAAVGTDASDLFGASFMQNRVAATDPRVIDSAIFDSYVAGLREVGWQDDTGMLRLAYAGHTALKYGLLLGWLPDVGNPAGAARWEALSGMALPAFLAHQAVLLYYLLDITEEALQQLA
jgi:hypothetical protein